ncbi:bifunctional phosphopantothenoylcysteine decarboxylase/phosphopantothenate--cysteine ligase CoaBC [Myxococcota bacterium]|nr:bifunctional phosphopantothenoylcysteine decarboxylase/phosphopantothenate--cysteine ligase CoaBC [Myxococcota bacterium]
MERARRVHICVTGGIAAYKAVILARSLIKAGATVQVAMTENARRFVGPLTFQGITQQPVLIETMDHTSEMQMGHINFAQSCDAIIVAPATANIIAKMAHGIADDLVSTLLLAASVPVFVAPAMNSYMYVHAATQANLQTLRARGVHIVEPNSGELACGELGPGRLAEPEQIAEFVEEVLSSTPPQRPPFSLPLANLRGRRVLISAGPTVEWLDPVRFLSNPSSGRTGFSLARVAAEAGAEVVLVHGPVSLTLPVNVRAVPVKTALDMRSAILRELPEADVVIMSAAVADWRPKAPAAEKQAKAGESLSIEMVRNPDILAELGATRQGAHPILVGFAAQTGDPIEAARDKLQRKGVDLIVANDVSRPDLGFASPENQVCFVSHVDVEVLPVLSKSEIARRILTWVSEHLR